MRVTISFCVQVAQRALCATHVVAVAQGNDAVKKRKSLYTGRKATMDSAVPVPQDVSRVLVGSSERLWASETGKDVNDS